MSAKPVIDAGPALNFLAINQQRLLLDVLGPISTPETVESEVLRKSRTDRRFERVGLVWSKLTPKWVEVLSDEWTDTLEAVCARQLDMPWTERKKQAKDLGELLVVAHAVAAAEQGQLVTVVIDDQSGARMATAEAQRLDRLRAQQRPVGRIILVNTTIILERAAGTTHIPDRAAMKAIYAKLRTCDDGLSPISNTRLLSADLWKGRGS
ncbi:hypothetical protein HLB23_40345 [Nocardia uniformis]|uniref:Uncharacterized protein n=1 Tax=Nocardia uniformis TaxID=53432 RepID=A0A849CBV5_9NOCA|nr:hypothetical protein [Nocardia uniformis]NNH76032.1 hypothetical protein [Nocardia uniformis]